MQERREIEAALHDGDLWAVAATNALELGVDVGSLDVTLHLGFPGVLIALPWCAYCNIINNVCMQDLWRLCGSKPAGQGAGNSPPPPSTLRLTAHLTSTS